jgi:transposase-like protein
MKTQLTKPARGKASYTKEYKQEALELWRASGRSAAKVAVELGHSPAALLYRSLPYCPRKQCKPRLTPRSRHTQPATAALRERRSRRFGYNFKRTPA